MTTVKMAEAGGCDVQGGDWETGERGPGSPALPELRASSLAELEMGTPPEQGHEG